MNCDGKTKMLLFILFTIQIRESIFNFHHNTCGLTRDDPGTFTVYGKDKKYVCQTHHVQEKDNSPDDILKSLDQLLAGQSEIVEYLDITKLTIFHFDRSEFVTPANNFIFNSTKMVKHLPTGEFVDVHRNSPNHFGISGQISILYRCDKTIDSIKVLRMDIHDILIPNITLVLATKLACGANDYDVVECFVE